MTVLLMLAVAAAAPPGEPTLAEQPPATKLAVSLAQAVGPTVHMLAIEAAPSVTPREREQITAAVSNTGFFRLVAPSKATAILRLERLDSRSITATVVSPQGRRIWVGCVIWPSSEVRQRTPEETEQVISRVLIYERQRLRIVHFARGYPLPPIVVGGVDTRWLRQPEAIPFAYANAIPASPEPNDWMIVRGPAQVVSETDLARLLGDTRLEKRIEKQRFWTRFWWGLGFGAGAAATLGPGVYLATRDSKDATAVGASLIAVGAVCTIMAALTPMVSRRHAMSATLAQQYVDMYNEKLRRRLDLTDDDIARFGRER